MPKQFSAVLTWLYTIGNIYFIFFSWFLTAYCDFIFEVICVFTSNFCIHDMWPITILISWCGMFSGSACNLALFVTGIVQFKHWMMVVLMGFPFIWTFIRLASIPSGTSPFLSSGWWWHPCDVSYLCHCKALFLLCWFYLYVILFIRSHWFQECAGCIVSSLL